MRNMKKIITLSLLVLAQMLTAQAQDKKTVAITGRKVEKSGDNVTVSFHMEIGKRVVRSNRTVVYEPVIKDGTYQWSLSPVIIQGHRARIAEKRHDWAAGHGIVYDNPKYARNKQSLDYVDSAPWQLWMHGADLTVDVTDMGCCSYTAAGTSMLAENLDLPAPTVIVEEKVAHIVERPKTTGDRMSETLSYVRPLSDFEKLEPGQLFDEDREGSLTVYYRQGNSKIDPGYLDNYRTLSEMVESINRLQASKDSRVSHVVIAGFASPEGAFELIDRLGWNRATFSKDYLLKYTGLESDRIQLYNGAEDWRGLRQMVEQSDLYDKAQIIWIIDNVPMWDESRGIGRETELMKLNNGQTYRFLYRNYFPLLRNAAYMKIYYENK